jgi:TonB-dependent SusC/RagA subfamily outer membrane receptor
MKNLYLLLLLLSGAVFSQNNDKSWSRVMALENEDKIKSAIEIVDGIYKKSFRNEDEAQLIKCFFYKSKYMQRVDENAQNKILEDLKSNINRVSKPSKAILNLVYAHCLTDFKNSNSGIIYNRSKIDTLASKNFLTWNYKDFENEIEKLYQKSTQDLAILEKTPLTNYEPVFDFFSMENFKKWSVLDYVLKENIIYYGGSLNAYNQQKDFLKQKEAFLGNSELFTKLNLDFVKDTVTKKVISYYQKLEEKASFENRFERLSVFNSRLIHLPSDYDKALNSLRKGKIDDYLLQKILYEKSNYLESLAKKDQPINYHFKTIEILDSILNIKNRSKTFGYATSLKNQITSKSLNLKLKKHVYANENTRAFVTYKNVDNIKISFYRISVKTDADLKNYKLSRDSILDLISTKNKPEKSITHHLINKKDYFDYTTEVLLPQLETGNYLVYFENENSENAKKVFGYDTMTVTNFSVLGYAKGNQNYFQVVDRKTGKPIENVTLRNPYFDIKTNKNGIANLLRNYDYSCNYKYDSFALYKDKDTLQNYSSSTTSFEDYSQEEDYSDNYKGKVEFYLDRAIYRPGQTVFYKGIAFQKRGVTSKIVANLLLKIIITNADDTDLKEFEVTTNEFGSFSGEFVLPKNGLTGDFQIEAEEPEDTKKCKLYDKKEGGHPFWDGNHFDDSEIHFKVEEYKRPKFEVTFDDIKEDFLVNQKIGVKGLAKAFAGSNITDAKVSYTITRNTYRYYYSKNSDYKDDIATGEVKTDANGKFNIEFTAEPDENSDKEELPVFSYSIKVDVTDLNGETRSSQTTVRVGYHALVLSAYLPSIVDVNDKNAIRLNSTNLNGEFKATKGDVKLYLKREYVIKFKNRLFEKPELNGISDSDFNKLFPYESDVFLDYNYRRYSSYDYDSKLVAKQELGTLVYSKTINTATDKEIALDFIKNYKSGHYTLVFSAKDKYDNFIETKKDFQLQDKSKPIANKLFTIQQLNKEPKKDGFISLKIHSNISELFLFSNAFYKNNVIDEQQVNLINGVAFVKIPVNIALQNTVKIGLEGVFENQYFKEETEVSFANEIEKINIETNTFRNKIEPGSNEFWSFKLKQKGVLLPSEVLASMYDSSLDQFTKTDWQRLDFYNYDSNYFSGKVSNCYDTFEVFLRNLNNFKGVPISREEKTQLMWFGFDFNSNYNYYKSEEYKRQITKKLPKPKNSQWISGYISDNAGTPLPGVSVLVKGSQRSTSSDFDGYFEIEAGVGESLVFSYIGFDSKTVTIADGLEYNIVLEASTESLKEVVVIGYGSQKRSMVTGAISTVSAKDISSDADSKTVFKALQGMALGVQVTAGAPGDGIKVTIRGMASVEGTEPLYVVDGKIVSDLKGINPSDIVDIQVLKDEKATAIYGAKAINGVILVTTKKAVAELTQVKARKNLSETAFFLPHLKTDNSGNLSFNFTSPEALTEWKLRLFAHNKNAISGYLQKSIVTQKELMVMPNFPRFLREKDSITITSKIANVTGKVKTGIAVLQFYDATTMESVDKKMLNTQGVKNFTIPAFGNTSVSWKIYVPEGLQGAQYKVLAKSGDFSDGEENILPVLTNSMLVTESIPIWVRENSKKEYTFNNLKNNVSTTLRNHQFTLEYTSNPTWIAIQSLPYLMEYEHGCAEQTFARFYSNAMASEIINSNPKIATVFENWRKNGKLVSKIEENEELKSIILAETPWFNDAKSETEQKQKLALLFDLEKMKNSQDAIFDLLKQKQKDTGGFCWFAGSDESEYMTRHILAGFGHLKKLSEKSVSKVQIETFSKEGIPFLDRKFIESNHYLAKHFKEIKKLGWANHYSDYHYLYARSFYLDDYPLSDTLKKTIKMHLDIVKDNWIGLSLYEKALVALTLHRFGETKTAKTIIQGLKETASNNEDWGMYWIENKSGWYWYQAPIETQAMFIEAFAEVANDTKSVDAMKVWLLKNKQDKNWATTKATTEAVYALLMQGTDWLSVKDNTVFKIGDEKIMTKKLSENQKEAETGYVKLTWKANEIKKEMATIIVENKSKVPGFGGVYWQYFEELDKIKNDNKGLLTVAKELYLKKTTSKGVVLEKITASNPLKIGDLVTVKLIITSTENLEFVHLKDMRASCFEPVNVLSEHKYEDGLSFYQSTKDVATHFFFDRIDKGTYVLEYEIRVNNSGDFSNGITTIQSMYAPEFTSHTKGIRVNVKE